MKAPRKIASGLRIAIYIRVSTEEQAENPEGSIRNQEERLRMAIKLKNMEGNFGEIAAVYIDRARSGKDTNRPELQKMLLAIRKGEIDLVMVSELSRISRSIKDFSQIWELMQKSNCGFTSLRENFDTTTAAGEMVLFTVANIAQFERRQISERVSANFNVRAQRGLYNGGCIPLGYKRIDDRPGYLAIDEDAVPTVKAAFRAFLSQGSLAPTAKWLNENGFRMKRECEGGGPRQRLGFFTVGNLKSMIKNKFYIGVKSFHQAGEMKETEAVWPAIIERDVFDKANTVLSQNFRRNKTAMIDRYPFLVSGLVSCACCGDRMVGKSAHGKAGKIPYYEHSWSTIKAASSRSAVARQCAPYRVLAKQLEPAIWNEVFKLLTQKKVAEELLANAQKAHQKNPGSREIEKYRQTLFSVDQQIEILAERLVSLPKSISAAPVYKQMEKLEALKRAAEKGLASVQESGLSTDRPSDLKSFEVFLASLRTLLEKSDSVKMRSRIIHLLIHKVLILPEGVEIHFKVGENFVKVLINKWSDRGRNGSTSLTGAVRTFVKLVLPQTTSTKGSPECPITTLSLV